MYFGLICRYDYLMAEPLLNRGLAPGLGPVTDSSLDKTLEKRNKSWSELS